ncbi:MAG: hypothetical protein R2704_12695 [Microthrixaceae bacterium]
MELHLPTGVHLPEGLFGQPEKPQLCGDELGALPPPPGEGEASRVKVSYTLCLGGLSFFLFILLTVTGIFLMFFYRPTAAQAWGDIYQLQTSVTFGLLVRNMHRWGAAPHGAVGVPAHGPGSITGPTRHRASSTGSSASSC